MTISMEEAGASVAGTTPLSVAYPVTGLQAGDLFVLVVSDKYAAPTTPSSPWVLPTNGQRQAGSGVSGVDTGSPYCSVYVRVAVGNETGSLSVTVTAANVSLARMWRYRKRADAVWGYACTNGADTTGNTTAWSATGAADPGIQAGDWVLCASAINQDAATTFSAQALSATGLTVGTMTERWDTGSNTGNDMSACMADFVIDAGTASAAPVYTMTASSTANADAPCGPTVFLRLREVIAWKDAASRFTLAAATPAVQDAASRFRLSLTAWKDASSRFTLSAGGTAVPVIMHHRRTQGMS